MVLTATESGLSYFERGNSEATMGSGSGRETYGASGVVQAQKYGSGWRDEYEYQLCFNARSTRAYSGGKDRGQLRRMKERKRSSIHSQNH